MFRQGSPVRLVAAVGIKRILLAIPVLSRSMPLEKSVIAMQSVMTGRCFGLRHQTTAPVDGGSVAGAVYETGTASSSNLIPPTPAAIQL